MAKKEKQDKVPVRTVNFKKSLPVQLTEPELLAYGTQMADAQDAVHEAEAELSRIKAEFKAKIEQAQATVNLMASRIRSKREYRDVPCKREFDYDAREVREVRADTDEVVDRRVMTDADAQGELDLLKEVDAKQ